jgi:flagellar hook-basal body complex protein FliE
MINPVAPIDMAAGEFLRLDAVQPQQALVPSTFSEIMTQGIEATNSKLVEADRMVAQYAVDPNIPLHDVTYALEQARLSFELMIQVRNRMLEASQQLLNMQI